MALAQIPRGVFQNLFFGATERMDLEPAFYSEGFLHIADMDAWMLTQIPEGMRLLLRRLFAVLLD